MSSAENLIKELIDAGIHFGHRVSRWNPKMKPYIYGKRHRLHLINVKETLPGLLLAKKFVAKVVSEGQDVLFVGTKRQARKCVQDHADRIGMHWVNDRWLGGSLTNFREIRKRVGRLDELEQMEADGQLDAFSKKDGSRLRREMRKIRRNLGGIRKMTRFPGVIVVIDQQHENIAIKEARKAGVPVICLVDTDADPDMVDIAIPGNDDAMRAIDIIVRELADVCEESKKLRSEGADAEDKPSPRRRSRRATTARAEDDDAADEAAPEDDAAPEAPAAEAPAPAAEAAAE